MYNIIMYKQYNSSFYVTLYDLKFVCLILRIFNFIGVKIKNKKDFPHCAWRSLNFDAIHIINFFWPHPVGVNFKGFVFLKGNFKGV